MEEEIKRIEYLIERCNECKTNACITCDICWSEVQAIKELLERYKHIKRTNSDLKCEQEQLYDKLDKLEEENKQLKVNEEILMKTKGCLNEDNSTNCRVLESLNYGIRAYEKTLRNSIPTSVIQKKIEELNRRIDYLNTELTKCYTEREKLGTETDIDNNETAIFYMEQEREYRNEQKQVLQELLEEGRNNK